MSDVNPFMAPGSWYKGALHVHTTKSDGARLPLQSMVYHQGRGYHFMAFTDHNVITDLSTENTSDFICIPGVEVAHGSNELGQAHHVVLVGIRSMVQPASVQPVQEAIDLWAGAAKMCFFAHPYWSGMILADLMPLEKLIGMEIWNTSAHTDLGKGLATLLWDDLLVRGKHWWGLAVDDTHGRNDDEFGGWVWVKSEKLDEDSIIDAIKSGAFYSSSGPEIHDVRIENGVVSVKCSPVATINIMGHTQWGYQRRAAAGKTINNAQYWLTGNERYVRVECVDGAGHAAWTNPIFLT